MPTSCCIETCYTSAHNRVRFPNPKKRLFLLKKWISAVVEHAPSILELSPEDIYKKRRICLAHFEEEFIQRNSLRGHLIKGAVPTIFLSKDEQLRKLIPNYAKIRKTEEIRSLSPSTEIINETLNGTNFLEELLNASKEIIQIPPLPVSNLDENEKIGPIQNTSSTEIINETLNETSFLEELLNASEESIQIPAVPVSKLDEIVNLENEETENSEILNWEIIQTLTTEIPKSPIPENPIILTSFQQREKESVTFHIPSITSNNSKDILDKGRVDKVKYLSEKAKSVYELAKKMKQRHTKIKIKRLQNNIVVT